MKKVLCSLLAAGLFSAFVSSAQTSTQTIQPTTRTEQRERKMDKMADKQAREARKARRVQRNNRVTRPADMRPNSPADVELKNGGSNRTGSQPAR